MADVAKAKAAKTQESRNTKDHAANNIKGRAAKTQARQKIESMKYKEDDKKVKPTKRKREETLKAARPKTEAVRLKTEAAKPKTAAVRPKQFTAYDYQTAWLPVVGSSHNVATTTHDLGELSIATGDRIIIVAIEAQSQGRSRESESQGRSRVYYAVQQPRGYTQGSIDYEHLFKPDPQGKVGKIVRLENLQKGKEECKVRIDEAGAGRNLAAYEKPRTACGSTWPTWSDLGRHMIKIHNVELPPKPQKKRTGKEVSCQLCKKNFSIKSSLKRHMKNHTKDIKKESLRVQELTDSPTPPHLILEHMTSHWLSKSEL